MYRLFLWIPKLSQPCLERMLGLVVAKSPQLYQQCLSGDLSDTYS